MKSPLDQGSQTTVKAFEHTPWIVSGEFSSVEPTSEYMTFHEMPEKASVIKTDKLHAAMRC
jgi:hypothetical protein